MANWQIAPPKRLSINSPGMAPAGPSPYLTNNGLPTTESGQDPYNPYRMGLPSTREGRKKREKVESSWQGGQAHLYDAYGPGAYLDSLRRLYQGQQQYADPILGDYAKAIGGYGDAGNMYGRQLADLMGNYGFGMSGALKGYGSGMQGAMDRYGYGAGQALGQFNQGMGNALSGFQKGAQGGIDAYGQAARGAAAQGYGAGVQSLGQGQSAINQRLSAGLARSGLSGTGIGQAQGALGAGAMAQALPGLQAQHAQQMAGIAQNQQGMQQDVLNQVLQGRMGQYGQGYAGQMGALGQLFGAGQGMQQGMLGTRMQGLGQIAGMGQDRASGMLGHAGNMLGAYGDLAGRRMGVLDQSNQLAQQDLARRAGLTPDIWSILGQQGMLDQSRKFNWEGLLQGAIGAGTGMIGNRLLRR